MTTARTMTWRFAAARARRVLAGGTVTVPQCNARTWGRDALTAWLMAPSSALAPDLLRRLRASRQHGWTLAQLYASPFPFPAPYA